MRVQISQLPEGTIVQLTTSKTEPIVWWQYEKREDGWVSETDYISDNDLIGLEEAGVDVQLLSWPAPSTISENTSDGYHTFKELYEMRLLLTAGLFNEWAEGEYIYGYHPPKVCKSKKHSDGTIPFNDPNWFIVVAETKCGQISFHYEMKDWDLFYAVSEVPLPPEYDGHTTADVADRIRRFLS